MRIFRVSYSEDEVYCNTDTINVADNRHLGTFKSFILAELFIDKHYCEHYKDAKPGEILKKAKETKDGYRYTEGLIEYNINIEEI